MTEARIINVGRATTRDVLYSILAFCDIAVAGNAPFGDGYNTIKAKYLLIEEDSSVARWCDCECYARNWVKNNPECKKLSLDHLCFHLVNTKTTRQ